MISQQIPTTFSSRLWISSLKGACKVSDPRESKLKVKISLALSTTVSEK